MRILCLNVGSSTLKWSAIEMPDEVTTGGATLGLAETRDIAARAGAVDAVAHRIVHGGARFRAPIRVDDSTRAALGELEVLDPLHLPAALRVLDEARRALPAVPHVACFDTAFHATLPDGAFTYALPAQWRRDFGFRRYGFHGLSVAHAVRQAQDLLAHAPRRLIVLHLGSGSSITAVANGRSVDTTMGFTPLEGVPMATRAGSIDPGIILHVLKERGLPADAVAAVLETQSGLAAFGHADLRELLAAADAGDRESALGYEVLLAGLRRSFGAMLAALDGMDAVVFTGGIGENSARLRADLLQPFAWLGLGLDPAKNAAPHGDAVLSPDGVSPAVVRIAAREDLTMSRDVFALLK